MTAEQSKLCFVISPLGSEGSTTRQLADDFLELLVEPALQPFSFEILRADKIASPSIITSDIIKNVQNADLCIIDLTDHNPNVFYECGRRHENGRPFIQLIRKGENLPFDVSGIRTISYDLSDPRSTLESVRLIQAYIQQMESTGYDSNLTGDSLSSIADGISRIERSLNSLSTDIIRLNSQSKNGQAALGKNILTEHPITSFNNAFESGDIDLAIKILPRIKKLIGTKDWLRSSVLIAQAGEPTGEAILKEALSIEDLDSELALEAFSGLYQYYFNRNMSREGANEIASLFADLSNRFEFSDEDKARVMGYVSVLHFQANNFDEALKVGLQILKLSREAIYLSNLAHVYAKLERFDEAVIYVDEFIDLPDANLRALQIATEVYKTLERDEDVKRTQEKITQLPQD